jgi:hypothetical protein
MSRTVPSAPHPASQAVDGSQRLTREWRDWLDKFVSALQSDAPLTGTVTFAAATSAAVTFTTPELTTSYNVALDSPENKTFWITSKTTTGFTINASSATSATVGWTVVRR